jgi:hypothetical protein
MLANFFYLACQHSTKMLRKFRVFHSAVKKARLAGAKLRGVFAAGLGGLGLLGWRTKRKNAAAIAAARNFQIAGRF